MTIFLSINTCIKFRFRMKQRSYHQLTLFVVLTQSIKFPFSQYTHKNNKYDTMRNKFVWESKLLTNQIRFISLFVVINEMTKL